MESEAERNWFDWLRQGLEDGSFWAGAALVAAVVVGAFVLHWALFAIVMRIARRSPSPEVPALVERTSGGMRLAIVTAALMLVLPLLGFRARVEVGLLHALKLVLIAAVAWGLVRLAAVVRAAVLANYDLKAKDNLQARKVQTQLRILERIAGALVVIFAIAAALMTFQAVRDIGVSILASAGVAGIVLGLAAQKTLGTMMAGLQLALTQPIRIDDVVLVEGEFGWVEEIRLTYVVVRVWDLRRIVLPTTYFIDQPFQNWTRVSADLLGTVFLRTDWRVPVEAVRDEMRRIVTASEHWDQKVCVLQVTDAKEGVLELRCLVSAADAPTLWNLRVELRERLVAWMQENHPDALPRVRLELDRGDAPPSGPHDGVVQRG